MLKAGKAYHCYCSPEELDSLADVQAEIRLGLGVIDVKDMQVEAPDVVARRIEILARRVKVERIAYLHPDCGLRMLPPPIAFSKLRALVAGRDRFLGTCILRILILFLNQ